MRRKHHSHDRQWHEDRLAEGPTGFIRSRGALTWDMLHDMCAKMVRDWEALPMTTREAYAFRNPEDRKR
jgi:hypothetical protein